jgi:hypothetical protein
MLSGTSARLAVGVSEFGRSYVGGKHNIPLRFAARGLSSRSLETGDSAPLLSTLMVGIGEAR